MPTDWPKTLTGTGLPEPRFTDISDAGWSRNRCNMVKQTIEDIITDFIKTSPDNSLTLDTGEPAWEEVIIGYSIGADPIYDSYKEYVGETHFTPLEIFNLTFYHDPAQPGQTAELGIYGDGQVFVVPDGYHFISPCPGYRLSYTWALGGPQKGFGCWVNDPHHQWLAEL